MWRYFQQAQEQKKANDRHNQQMVASFYAYSNQSMVVLFNSAANEPLVIPFYGTNALGDASVLCAVAHRSVSHPDVARPDASFRSR